MAGNLSVNPHWGVAEKCPFCMPYRHRVSNPFLATRTRPFQEIAPPEESPDPTETLQDRRQAASRTPSITLSIRPVTTAPPPPSASGVSPDTDAPPSPRPRSSPPEPPTGYTTAGVPIALDSMTFKPQPSRTEGCSNTCALREAVSALLFLRLKPCEPDPHRPALKPTCQRTQRVRISLPFPTTVNVPPPPPAEASNPHAAHGVVHALVRRQPRDGDQPDRTTPAAGLGGRAASGSMIHSVRETRALRAPHASAVHHGWIPMAPRTASDGTASASSAPEIARARDHGQR
jgi:hypothetical protein